MARGDERVKPPSLKNEIPDMPGAETGLRGVKAPFSYRQEGDIRDRLQAAGKIKPGDLALKR